MKISIYNFKGIERFEDYDSKSLTILTGSNSSGKSTVIQFLLMLKQSLQNSELESDSVLVLNKPYVSLGSYRNIIRDKNEKNNKFRIKFLFERNDFIINRDNRVDYPGLLRRVFSTKDLKRLKDVTLDITFRYSETLSKIYVDTLNFNLEFEETPIYLKLHKSLKKYDIRANSDLFFDSGYSKYSRVNIAAANRTIKQESSNISYNFDEIALIELNNYVDFKGFIPMYIRDIEMDARLRISPIFSHFRRKIEDYFDEINYLGPLREAPKPYYFHDDDSIIRIGNKGEFAPHILAKHEKKKVRYMRPANDIKDGFVAKEEYLIDSVKYWMCTYFGMAKNISIKKQNYGTFYVVRITNANGSQIPINQVGFGVSQILPIIVQGLLMENEQTLILEQPEIHLHPSVQSKLLDFILSLIIGGKKVIVETHSDHLITRLRRRIVEGVIDNLVERLSVYFVSRKDKVLDYSLLTVDELGNFNYWPKDFFDEKEKDLRAIIEAQLKKVQS